MPSLPRPVLALLLALTPLVLALGAQYGLGLQPCFLCHLQRLPWIGPALLAAVTWARSCLACWSVPAACALIVAGLGLSGWHLALEEGWLLQPSACGAATSGALSAEELRCQSQAAAAAAL